MHEAIKMESSPTSVDAVVDTFFSGHFLDGARDLVKLTVSAIAENVSLGEHELSNCLLIGRQRLDPF